MAQAKKRRPSGSVPKQESPPKATGAAAPRTPVGYGPQGSAIRRQSVAASRPKAGNKTQLYILAAASVVILLVVVAGIIWNISNNKAENDGYGNSRSGIALLGSGGDITVSNGTPSITVDIYEDPLCPYCAAFEHQYGQQIAQAVDEGKLAVSYHLLNFLDGHSFSGNYSTRAAAALMCAASSLGSTKALWPALHATIFDDGVQPSEGGSSDLTNEQLGQQIVAAATGVGLAVDAAPVLAATSCVSGGAMLDTVKSSYNTSAATLTALVGGVGSPVIVHDGATVDVDDTAWLSKLLAS